MSLTMQQLLTFMIKQKGSDLHLSADAIPRIRIHGDLKPLSMPALDQETARHLISSILSEEQMRKVDQQKDLDASYELPGVSRFRVNVYFQRGRIRTTIRAIPEEIKTFEELGMPREVFQNICALPKGLILVTGATGSGKSTTLASMIDYLNNAYENHIVTIEDPIEFVHQDKKCMVSQREIGADTPTFASALKHVLRQDPDIVLIGEMRDMETVQTGLELSETGHLTFATLHTSDAVQTINRVIDIFPPGQQPQIRTQLGFTLEAVICQQLLKKKDGKGRVVALEILLATQGVRANIRGDKIHQIYSTMQTSGQLGMLTMNQSLYNLVEADLITPEFALEYSSRAEELDKMMRDLTMGPAARSDIGRAPQDMNISAADRWAAEERSTQKHTRVEPAEKSEEKENGKEESKAKEW